MASDTAAAPPSPDAEPPGNVELPRDVLPLVLLPLKGDVASLCAAACVSRAWRGAVTFPRLWTHIGPFSGGFGARLTDARLMQLVARARGGLQVLKLTNISRSSITDAGLAAALGNTSRLRVFAANGMPLTGAGIAAALAGSQGRMRKLRVCGVRAAPAVDDGDMPRDSWEAALGALHALLAPDGEIDAAEFCNMAAYDYRLDGPRCARMCTGDDGCYNCEAMCCSAHKARVQNCLNCIGAICDCCRSQEVTAFGVPLCEPCGLSPDWQANVAAMYDLPEFFDLYER